MIAKKSRLVALPWIVVALLLVAGRSSHHTTTTGAAFIVRRPKAAGQHRCSRYYKYNNVLSASSSLSSEEVQSRLLKRIALLREKDRKGKIIDVKDLNIVYEDDDLIVVDKPAGALCVPSEPDGIPSLVQTVFDYVCHEGLQTTTKTNNGDDTAADDDDSIKQVVTSSDQMVVHRLGFDTSGLIVFAKNLDAVRGMNTIFRTRKITRQYEVLVVGHFEQDQGLINLPLMRCYEYPPYMRISTDEHQQNLVDLDPAIVGKKLLEAPKASLTHYQVMRREYWKDDPDLPVTRMTLTSMTGRTHQLNVHCAAVGHPIVHDTVYGYAGSAAPHGGLEESQLPADRASLELQKAIAEASVGFDMCVHAKLIRFQHPTTGADLEFTSTPSF